MSDPDAMLDIVLSSRRGASPVLVGRAAEMGGPAARGGVLEEAAAAAAWEAVGQPYQAASALTYAARIALAERAGRAAAPVAERLAAGPLAAQIADLTARSGTDADAADPGLTSRELEVLRLVAAGQSNREIAGALVISPKTASVHVSNILAKLGAATRTEAAVKAHRLLLLRLPVGRGRRSACRSLHCPECRELRVSRRKISRQAGTAP
jgi:DNA-binding CsgD family transcriptional regulator